MKLTIIIPVYKVEAYLNFCLKSIARQNVEDYEVILVDDGSPDRSGALCDAWVRKDGRFRVIHCPENRGLSAARNRGLDEAHGEYVTFVDSDDYISPHTLQANMELLALHPEADVLEYPYASTTARQKPTVIRPEHAKSRITPDGHTAKATYIVMLGTKSINARCGSLSASRKADGMRMSSPSRPYCAKHDTSCVRTKGYIIIAVDKALSPTPSVTRASMTFSRPTSRYIAHCPTIQTLTTRIWTMLTYTVRPSDHTNTIWWYPLHSRTQNTIAPRLVRPSPAELPHQSYTEGTERQPLLRYCSTNP